MTKIKEKRKKFPIQNLFPEQTISSDKKSQNFHGAQSFESEESRKISDINKFNRKTIRFPSILKRERTKSMDNQTNIQFEESLSKTLTGPIVMIIKDGKAVTEAEIVKKIEPIFHLFNVEKQTNIILQTPQKYVEECLRSLENKVFLYNQKNKKWSLCENKEINNYFASLEDKMEKYNNVSHQHRIFGRIRKRNLLEYANIIDKLELCMKRLSKNEKIWKLVRKNPFKKIKKLKKDLSAKNEDFQDEILSEILTSNSMMSEERFIGIMQSFYYFFPLLKEKQNSPIDMTVKFMRTMNKHMEGFLNKN